MNVKNLRALEKIKQKKQALQDREDKIRHDLLADLSQHLIASRALEVDFAVLMGGLLEVVDTARKGSPKVEEWKTAGQQFCQGHRKNKPGKTLEAAKNPHKD